MMRLMGVTICAIAIALMSASSADAMKKSKSRVSSPSIADGSSGFKITDNEAPRPRDRIFGIYNYYNSPVRPGTFVDIHVGFGNASSQWIEPVNSTDRFDFNGGVAGIGLLYIPPFERTFVDNPVRLPFFGIGSYIDLTDFSGDTIVNCASPCETSNNFLGATYGLLGLNTGPVAPYVIAGVAYGDIKADVAGFPGDSTVEVGWMAGLGVMIPVQGSTTVLNLRFEHIDLGSPQVCAPATCGGIADIDFEANIFKIGVNIPLNPPPVEDPSVGRVF